MTTTCSTNVCQVTSTTCTTSLSVLNVNLSTWKPLTWLTVKRIWQTSWLSTSSFMIGFFFVFKIYIIPPKFVYTNGWKLSSFLWFCMKVKVILLFLFLNLSLLVYRTIRKYKIFQVLKMEKIILINSTSLICQIHLFYNL